MQSTFSASKRVVQSRYNTHISPPISWGGTVVVVVGAVVVSAIKPSAWIKKKV